MTEEYEILRYFRTFHEITLTKNPAPHLAPKNMMINKDYS